MNSDPNIITIHRLMTAQDIATALQISVKTARQIMREKQTVRVGRRLRMTYTTFRKNFLEKEA